MKRKKIADEISNTGSYNSQENKLINEIKYEKRIDFVIGIPGGGKSSTLANPLSEEHSSVIIDADIAKEKLPEYDGGKGAGRVHEESKKYLKKH